MLAMRPKDDARIGCLLLQLLRTEASGELKGRSRIRCAARCVNATLKYTRSRCVILQGRLSTVAAMN